MTMAKVFQRTMLRLLSGTGKQLIKGYADAQSNLGIMYDNGNGVPENDAEAVKWYRKAADQGNAKAQYNLGVMYAMATVFQRTMLRQLSGTGKQLIKGMQRLSST